MSGGMPLQGAIFGASFMANSIDEPLPDFCIPKLKTIEFLRMMYEIAGE